ncbi:hypothetical protein BKA63DRAFT_506912 [Paraphoma chrysanthemicola]|nr:hypothetical protein BKA63DRAFT_506912 [Paraphoma chrysanthemicola]
MPSKERQTADAIVQAFNSADIPTIISLRTPTCLRVFQPATLKFGSQTNEQYRTSLEAILQVFTSFQITVTDLIEGVSECPAPTDEKDGFVQKKKIIMYVNARGDTPIGEYVNQYVWKMGFEEGGERVNEWEEYVDVGMAKDFFPRLQAEMKRRAEEKAKEDGKQ